MQIRIRGFEKEDKDPGPKPNFKEEKSKKIMYFFQTFYNYN